MKKLLTLTLGCLLFCTLTTSALANGWGLRGGVYDIVSDDDRYESYTAIADNGNDVLAGGFHANQAILQNRYDALLISASRDGKVWTADHVNHTAVYQPGDKRGEYPNTPVLEHIGYGFKLSYGENESYIFACEDGQYILHDVRYRQNEMYTDCFVRQDGWLEFWESNPGGAFLPVGDARWEATITLDEFNIAQMPRSMAEVRQLSMVSNALMDAPPLEIADTWSGAKDSAKLAVYSAPDAASYRSAEGKASVSLGGEIRIYGTQDGWTLIGYEVSPRTSRIGYVQQELGEEPLAFANVPLTAAADTFLTDDPFVSQFAQADIPKGAALTGLAKCGEYYAYVEYQADKLYRGFVPLKDLITTYDRALSTGTDLPTAAVRWDVMDALCGKWEHSDDEGDGRMILFSDGTYRNHMPGDGARYREEGNYRVYDVAEGDGATYQLYIRTEDNQETTYTMRLNEDGTITLKTDWTETVCHRDEYSTYGNG